MKIKVVIAAAGKGTRSGLSYPKTLYEVDGVPIIVRLCRIVSFVDDCPTIVVSPGGRDDIADCLGKYDIQANFAVQKYPTGMGDAVLASNQIDNVQQASHILLLWGDLPFIRKETLRNLIACYAEEDYSFVFPSIYTDKAYTRVHRGSDGRVLGIEETRAKGLEVNPGERDIGVFLFNKEKVYELLRYHAPKCGIYSNVEPSGEHGFLYVVEKLGQLGEPCQGIDIASERETISLNYISDLDL